MLLIVDYKGPCSLNLKLTYLLTNKSAYHDWDRLPRDTVNEAKYLIFDRTLAPLFVLCHLDRVCAIAPIPVAGSHVEVAVSELRLRISTMFSWEICQLGWTDEPGIDTLIVGAGTRLRRCTLSFFDTVFDVVALFGQLFQLAQVWFTLAFVAWNCGTVIIILYAIICRDTIALTKIARCTSTWSVFTLVQSRTVRIFMAFPLLLNTLTGLAKTVERVPFASAILITRTLRRISESKKASSFDLAFAQNTKTGSILDISTNFLAVPTELAFWRRRLAEH